MKNASLETLLITGDIKQSKANCNVSCNPYKRYKNCRLLLQFPVLIILSPILFLLKQSHHYYTIALGGFWFIVFFWSKIFCAKLKTIFWENVSAELTLIPIMICINGGIWFFYALEDFATFWLDQSPPDLFKNQREPKSKSRGKLYFNPSHHYLCPMHHFISSSIPTFLHTKRNKNKQWWTSNYLIERLL